MNIEQILVCYRVMNDPYVPECCRQWAEANWQWHFADCPLSSVDIGILSELAFSYNAGLFRLYAELGDRR